MSGFNGRAFRIMRGTVAAPLGVIAAVRTKSATRAREPVDVTNDDDNGNRVLLPEPGVRSIDVSVEGVASVDNYNWMIASWNGNVMDDIFIENADGSTEEAADGFFLSSLEHSGESAGDVAFTAQFMSSGAITFTPAA
jgi:predicted secreted protein